MNKTNEIDINDIEKEEIEQKLREMEEIEAECYTCRYKVDIPGHELIGCDKPDKKMTGTKYGIKNKLFFYPFFFDPIWKEKRCDNHEEQEQEEEDNI